MIHHIYSIYILYIHIHILKDIKPVREKQRSTTCPLADIQVH